MRKSLYFILLVVLIFTLNSGSYSQSRKRYLVLDFDCYGEAAGKSNVIGDSLRHYMKKSGANIVSEDLTSKLISGKKLNESDLNYMLEDLKILMNELNANAAVYGHVLSSYDLLTVEMRLIEKNQPNPVLFDPIVCGRLQDIYQTIPRMAELVLSPDKSAPTVLSVAPSDGAKEVGQYIDMTIAFSKPMNPSTFSITGYPENMWARYGEAVYDESTYTFIFKLHLYPDIEYEFHINGVESKGFKDERGNVAHEYVWKFTTGQW